MLSDVDLADSALSPAEQMASVALAIVHGAGAATGNRI